MSRSSIQGYVFGYGTLADPNDWLIQRDGDRFPPTIYTHIAGYRRHWDMAADNAAPEHDNKYHADIATGARPDIKVVAMGLEEAPEIRCNGRAIPVDEQRLAWFDQREEKLYTREEILPDRIEADLGQPLWAYFPNKDSLATFEQGLEEGNVFYPAYYTRVVEDAFSAVGPEALEDYRQSTRPPRCPARDLKLVRAPGDAGI
jgi:hypothetical protein